MNKEIATTEITTLLILESDRELCKCNVCSMGSTTKGLSSLLISVGNKIRTYHMGTGSRPRGNEEVGDLFLVNTISPA